MKKTVRILALLLCLSSLFILVGCGEDQSDDAPEGMQNATAAGSDFRLYIPTTWNVNTAYGVSGGYFNLTKQSTVSVVKYDITDEIAAVLPEEDAKARTDAFWTAQCKPVLENGNAVAGHFSELSRSVPTTLETANAYLYHCKNTVNGVMQNGQISQMNLQFLQVIAERKNAFYVFTFTVLDELYEILRSDVDGILAAFKFDDTPYVPKEEVKIVEGDGAPAGMKIASNQDVPYCFYVPTEWTIDANQSIFAAYLESDRSSVSVVPYMLKEAMSVDGFFAESERLMQQSAGEGGYERYELPEGESKITIGGQIANVYTYRFRVGGKDYYYKQIVVPHQSIYGPCFYSMTYTAPSKEAYNAHLADLDRMIAAFTFR